MRDKAHMNAQCNPEALKLAKRAARRGQGGKKEMVLCF